jgi:hypothetical protein
VVAPVPQRAPAVWMVSRMAMRQVLACLCLIPLGSLADFGLD